MNEAETTKSKEKATRRVRGEPRFFRRDNRIFLTADFTEHRDDPAQFVAHAHSDVTDSNVLAIVAEHLKANRAPKQRSPKTGT